MRTIIFAGLLLLGQTGFAQSFKEKVSTFNRLSVSRGIEATLYASESTELEFRISGVDREDIVVEENNGMLKLKISSEGLWEQLEDEKNWYVKVNIPFQTLEALEVSTGANVYARDPIRSSQLEVESSTGGEIEASIEGGSLFLQNTMGGIMEISGKVDDLDVSCNMGAITDARDLVAAVVRAKANMGGELKVQATESFSGKASMGGYIRVYGNPERFRDSSTMGGEITNTRH